MCKGIEIDKSEGIFIYDKNGKKYFDLIAGIAVSNFGHQHPHIIKAIKKQIDKHLHVMVFGEYSQEIQNKLAIEFSKLLPENLLVQISTKKLVPEKVEFFLVLKLVPEKFWY